MRQTNTLKREGATDTLSSICGRMRRGPRLEGGTLQAFSKTIKPGRKLGGSPALFSPVSFRESIWG